MKSTANENKTDKVHTVFKYACRLAFALAFAAALIIAIIGAVRVADDSVSFLYYKEGAYKFVRATTPEEEGYSEDEHKICPVEYVWEGTDEDGNEFRYSFVYEYTYEEWKALGERTQFLRRDYILDSSLKKAYGSVYREATEKKKDGTVIYGDRFVATITPAGMDSDEMNAAVRNINAEENSALFSAAITLGILSVSFAVIGFFGKHFSIYEKSWFLGIMVLAAIFAIIFPEESAGGVSGIVIMLLYLADTFLNILCELLISKQSKWNFIVSVFVEITEILICIVLSYRFATMATTLFFWLPVDIVSFINWNRKKNTDNDEKELTKVRTLKGWQEILVIVGIAVWTLVVGYFLSGLDITSSLFGGNDLLEDIVCYIDACASAVGIVNGLAILFRFREQWIAWYICSILEAVINILAGQYVLLVLKLGYLTNTTYGYFKWTKYIKEHPELVEEKAFF